MSSQQHPFRILMALLLSVLLPAPEYSMASSVESRDVTYLATSGTDHALHRKFKGRRLPHKKKVAPGQQEQRKKNKAKSGHKKKPVTEENDDASTRKERRPRAKINRARLLRIANRVACVNGRWLRKTCLCKPKEKQFRPQPNVFICLRLGQEFAGGKLNASTEQVKNVAQSLKPRPKFATSETLASIPLATTAQSLDGLAKRHGLEVAGSWAIKISGRRIVKFRARDGRSPDDMAQELLRESLILSVQKNFYYERQSITSPAAQALPQYALERIGAIAAHEIATGHGSLVAIVDSGIDQLHPDLAGKIAATFKVSPGASKISDPHGTAVAGLVAAEGLILGVAPDARLLDVRVFAAVPEGEGSAASSESLLRGLDWAAEQKANVINMSLEGPPDPLLEEVISALLRQDIAVVAAAGNGGADATPAYPAAYDGVIAVTATGSDDAAYEGANRGDYIDLAAPGIDLLVTSPDEGYRFETGTSFAAAEVTGIIALMLSRKPEMNIDQISAALARGADDLGSPGRDRQFGFGLVNAWNSLQIK